ncbi:hypothetical protein Tco_0803324 [Tanacetum coccineum]|uniref:Uncharacterized protein n=1 Tax=Tanacetum coccineum TaxID=301880 RepID=A0ABQ5A3Q8_9ASTR
MVEPKKPLKKKDQIALDEELALGLHAEEQAELERMQKERVVKEESRMLVEMIAERKKFFAAQRAAEQRSKPPTKTQIRNIMCTYLKNMGGYKHNQLKGRSYEETLEASLNKHTNSGYELESDKSRRED